MYVCIHIKALTHTCFINVREKNIFQEGPVCMQNT